MLPESALLASRSPRRLELLSLLIDRARIEVVVPPSSDELEFDSLTTWPEIRQRLLEIARHKATQVCELRPQRHPGCIVIAADTTVIVAQGAPVAGLDDSQGQFCALGQPPDGAAGTAVVRDWFRQHYLGRTHWAATAVVATGPDGARREGVATTAVTFRAAAQHDVDWYISTGEPRGKAGGYALQGLGSTFVERIEGSLTNVVGLPLELLRALLPDA